MDWQERMNAAMDYLEDHMEGEIDWGRAAAEANCSTIHFLRMFEVISGVSAGEYVRRRRLSLAAIGLSAGGARVIDQALRFGYESPDAFSKAFRREFGISPSEARQPGIRLKTWPRFSFTVVLKGSIPMNFRIENHEAIRFTGLPLRTTSEKSSAEIPLFWLETRDDGRREAFEKAMRPDSKLDIMGVCLDDFDSKTREFTYLIAIETPNDRSHLPKGCVDVTAKPMTWAIFESHGPMPTAIQETWKKVMGEWFPTSGYEHAAAPDFERYPEGDPGAQDYYSEIWIPVRKSSK